MYTRKLVGIAVAATITMFCAVKADAESQASFQAGSSAGAMNDSQANGENSSQATSRNSTQSINEQNSHATSANSSAAGAEEMGGPLTNSRPGNSNNAKTGANNAGAGNLNGSNPSNVINGGSGYFNAGNTGNTPSTNQNRPPVNSSSILPDPDAKNMGAGMTHRPSQLSHVPVPVVKTYSWSKHKQSVVHQSNSHLIGARPR